LPHINLIMDTKKSTTKYWLFFIVWTAVMVFMLITPSVRQYFWLTLPGVCLNFVRGMDLI
jgi:hypothetical protein